MFKRHHLTKPIRASAAGLAAIALLVGGTAVPANATTTPSVGIGEPPGGYWVLHLAAGQSYSSTVEVSNPGTTAAIYDVGGVWAATGATSGIGYSRVGEAAPPGTLPGYMNLSQWISGGTSSEILPGHLETVPWTVTVPAGTPTGTYLGGIGASPENSTTSWSSSGGKELPTATVGIVNDVEAVVAVEVIVGSPSAVTASVAPALANNWAYGGGVANVTIDYTGNVLAAPSLSLEVSTCNGSPVFSGDRSLMDFAPHTRIVYPWTLASWANPNYLDGCYVVSATLTYAGKVLASDTQTGTITASSATWTPSVGSGSPLQAS